ncbi:TIGR03826 family flagellar region protein [Rummeliibacillus pycnus]|uniref:TIGR03826 family flagellar region protein n=1 Tax=Rummeliibacillus pycnus TaxID=101070 RepID=UPI0037C5E876
MGELRNCPKCGSFYNYTGVREVCPKCAQEEEQMYEVVYRFLRRRENRAATVDRIVEATGVEKELLYKWVRKNRLQPALFPNLGYPCDNCGHLTNQGKLCDDCTEELKSNLNKFEAGREFRKNIEENNKATYLAERRKK